MRGLECPRQHPVKPRAKNCLRALAILSFTAGLAKKDLLQVYPKHFAFGMTAIGDPTRLIDSALGMVLDENLTTSSTCSALITTFFLSEK